MRRSNGMRAIFAVVVSAQVFAVSAMAVGAQPQQPQYGEGPGAVTRSLPTTGSGDVQQPIYGEGPGVIGKGLPNTGSGPVDESQPIVPMTLIIAAAASLFGIAWARGRRLSAGVLARRILVVTRGASVQS